MKIEYVKQLLAAMLIFLFVYTACSKLLDFSMFHAQLMTYPFVKSISGILAIFIPLTELLIVIMLFVPSTRAKGFFGSVILLSVFSAYLVLMLNTQNNLPCSCGGVIEKLSWQAHIIFNVCFIMIALVGYWLEKRTPLRYLLSNQKDN